MCGSLPEVHFSIRLPSASKLTFVSDLPLGKYYVQEMTAPKGYVKSDKVFDVDASYQGDDKKVIEFDAEFENKPIKVQISKTDITGDNELEGAVHPQGLLSCLPLSLPL